MKFDITKHIRRAKPNTRIIIIGQFSKDLDSWHTTTVARRDVAKKLRLVAFERAADFSFQNGEANVDVASCHDWVFVGYKVEITGDPQVIANKYAQMIVDYDAMVRDNAIALSAQASKSVLKSVESKLIVKGTK